MVTRSGFGMVEVIVALTILTVGMLGIAATATLSGRMARTARAEERAVRAAERTLDSLLQVEVPASGAWSEDGIELLWTAAPGDSAFMLRLTARYWTDSGPDSVTFAAQHLLLPPYPDEP